jgi:hypothetical protein
MTLDFIVDGRHLALAIASCHGLTLKPQLLPLVVTRGGVPARAAL